MQGCYREDDTRSDDCRRLLQTEFRKTGKAITSIISGKGKIHLAGEEKTLSLLKKNKLTN
jgi:hypothetical protein